MNRCESCGAPLTKEAVAYHTGGYNTVRLVECEYCGCKYGSSTAREETRRGWYSTQEIKEIKSIVDKMRDTNKHRIIGAYNYSIPIEWEEEYEKALESLK